MKSIYEEFGCRDMQELYLKFASDDESIKDLKEYMYYYSIHKDKKTQSITSRRDFKRIAQKIASPGVGHINILCVDTKNNFRHLLYNKALKSEKEILYDLVKLNSSGCFIIGTSSDKLKIEEFNKKVSRLIVPIIDFIYYEKDLQKEETYEGYIYKEDTSFPKGIKYNRLSGYEEFTQNFVKREILGLNFATDRSRIREVLSLGLDRYEREVVGICVFDDKKNIISTEFMYAGTDNSCILREREILRRLLEYDSKSFLVFHNHPSGDATASSTDYETTGNLISVSEAMGINFFDHFIVGHGNCFSVMHDEIPKEYNLQKDLKKLFADAGKLFEKEENGVKNDEEKVLTLSLSKDLVKKHDKYIEVSMPDGLEIDGVSVGGKKFYPLKVIRSKYGSYDIPLQENQVIYFNDGFKVSAEKIFKSLNETEKKISAEKKGCMIEEEKLYKIKEKILGEEI